MEFNKNKQITRFREVRDIFAVFPSRLRFPGKFCRQSGNYNRSMKHQRIQKRFNENPQSIWSLKTTNKSPEKSRHIMLKSPQEHFPPKIDDRGKTQRESP